MPRFVSLPDSRCKFFSVSECGYFVGVDFNVGDGKWFVNVDYDIFMFISTFLDVDKDGVISGADVE